MPKQSERSQTAIEYLLLIGASVIFTIIITLATRDIIFPAGEDLGDKGDLFASAKASFEATSTVGIVSVPTTPPGTCPVGAICLQPPFCDLVTIP
ncbi:MAG: hypothetical protein AABX01_08015, partial [Candidatus Micrarchaeota archaeon]